MAFYWALVLPCPFPLFSLAADCCCCWLSQAVAGQTAALALKRVKRSSVRKGMVLVDERVHPRASWEFEAEIAILTHATTIQPKYQVRWAGILEEGSVGWPVV